MHRSSMFGIMLDPKRGRGTHLYDLSWDEFVLDFFGLYSTLPLGYNHPIFDEASFKEEILDAAQSRSRTARWRRRPLKSFLRHLRAPVDGTL